MKVEFSFRKDVDGTIYATAGDWINEFSPDGCHIARASAPKGKEITREEAEDILWAYGWAICPQCGNIYPTLGECLW